MLKLLLLFILACKFIKINAMSHLNFKSVNPAAKFLIVILTIATLGIIVFFTGLLIGRIIFWMNLDQVNDVLYGRYELITNWQLKYFQMVQCISFFIIPGFFLNWLFSTPTEKYFNIYKPSKVMHLTTILCVFIFGMPLINWIIQINENLSFPDILNNVDSGLRQTENAYAQLTNRLLEANNMAGFLFNILMIAILPAIGEELIFRGILQKLFSEILKNIHVAVIITAILFSVVHGQFFGIIPRFVLGIFLGYLMVWSKSIWLPIFAHFTNNALAVTMFYLQNNNILRFTSYSVSGGNNIPIVLVTSILVSLLLIIYLRKSVIKNAAIN
jgi:membrane protease YdiL (CAAX protease family)